MEDGQEKTKLLKYIMERKTNWMGHVKTNNLHWESIRKGEKRKKKAKDNRY